MDAFDGVRTIIVATLLDIMLLLHRQRGGASNVPTDASDGTKTGTISLDYLSIVACLAPSDLCHLYVIGS